MFSLSSIEKIYNIYNFDNTQISWWINEIYLKKINKDNASDYQNYLILKH